MLHFVKNKTVLTGLAICLIFSLQAQVRFNLSLMPDQQTYLVSMLPDATWQMPENIVGGAQICLQMPAGKPFLAGQIKSLIPGTTWIDNAYFEKATATADFQYVCFSLSEMGTKAIPFSAGVETPLFSFKNLEPGCIGVLELVENNDPVTKAVVAKDRVNITQNMTVLGAGGNAYAGLLNGRVDCALISTTEEHPIVSKLRVFPVPATDVLQVAWENSETSKISKLLVNDMLGRQMALENTSAVAGEQQLRLDVASYPTGLYLASLVNQAGERQSFRFIVTRK
jgi:hypothetical protein